MRISPKSRASRLNSRQQGIKSVALLIEGSKLSEVETRSFGVDLSSTTQRVLHAQRVVR